MTHDDAVNVLEAMAKGSAPVAKLEPEDMALVVTAIERIDIDASEAIKLVRKRALRVRAGTEYRDLPHVDDFLGELHAFVRNRDEGPGPRYFYRATTTDRPDERREKLPPQIRPMTSIREARGDKAEAVRLCPMLGEPYRGHARMIDAPLWDAACRDARGTVESEDKHETPADVLAAIEKAGGSS